MRGLLVLPVECFFFLVLINHCKVESLFCWMGLTLLFLVRFDAIFGALNTKGYEVCE